MAAYLSRRSAELQQVGCDLCGSAALQPTRLVACRHLLCGVCAEATIRYFAHCPVCHTGVRPPHPRPAFAEAVAAAAAAARGPATVLESSGSGDGGDGGGDGGGGGGGGGADANARVDTVHDAVLSRRLERNNDNLVQRVTGAWRTRHAAALQDRDCIASRAEQRIA
jgi:hypothetical protein